MTVVEVLNGKVLVNGEETTNPELIGLAVLDLVEESEDVELFIKDSKVNSN